MALISTSSIPVQDGTQVIDELPGMTPEQSYYLCGAEDDTYFLVDDDGGTTVQEFVAPASGQDKEGLSLLSGGKFLAVNLQPSITEQANSRHKIVQEPHCADTERLFRCVYREKRFHQDEQLHLHVKRKHTVMPSGGGTKVVNNSHLDGTLPVCVSVAVNPMQNMLTDTQNLQPEALLNNSRLFKCLYCEKSFSRAGQLKVHEKVHDEERPYPCTYCGKGFKYSWGLKVHERLHTGEKPFECRYCGKAFASSFNKSQHEQTHLGSMERVRFWCRDCSISYSRKQALKAHIRTKHLDGAHVPVVKWKCSYCARLFPKQEDLEIHIRSHTGEKPLQCKYCPQRYARPSNLQVHLRKHIKPEPLKCEYCLESFQSKYQLAIHKRIHTGRLLKCLYCERRFAHSGRKKLHERMHTGDKKHECNYCSRLYATLEEQKKHESNVHNNGNPFRCKYCQSCFTSSFALSTHVKKLHGKRSREWRKFACKYCGRQFNKYSVLSTHERRHGETYECTGCQRFFKTRTIMNMHMKRHRLRGEVVAPQIRKAKASLCVVKYTTDAGEQHYLCTDCGSTMTEMSKVVEHQSLSLCGRGKCDEVSERELFHCARCTKAFRSQRSLRLHIKRHHKLNGETVASEMNATAESSPCFMKCFTEVGQEHYVCKECGKNVRKLSEAVAHQQLMHSEQEEQEVSAVENTKSAVLPTQSAEEDCDIEILEAVSEMQYCEEMSQPTSDVVISQASDSKVLKQKAKGQLLKQKVVDPPATLKNRAIVCNSQSTETQMGTQHQPSNGISKLMGRVCQICLVSFSSVAELQEHEQMHNLYSCCTSSHGLMYVCKLCGRIVHKARELVIHKSLHKAARKRQGDSVTVQVLPGKDSKPFTCTFYGECVKHRFSEGSLNKKGQ